MVEHLQRRERGLKGKEQRHVYRKGDRKKNHAINNRNGRRVGGSCSTAEPDPPPPNGYQCTFACSGDYIRRGEAPKPERE